jgi:lysozyme
MNMLALASVTWIIGFWLVADCTRAAELDRDKLAHQLIKHEGKRTKVYKDSEGIPTIGVGFNLTRADAKKKIEDLGLDYLKVKAGEQELSEAQVSKLLKADIDNAIADCMSVFPKFSDLSEVRQRALADMMFNLGKERFSKFHKLIANVKEGKYLEAADEMKTSKWYEQVKARGRTLESMIRTGKDSD